MSIGEDGPSQMGLEDLAMFRTVPGCVVFYPSDAVSAERGLELAANYRGMTYTRITRGETCIIYGPDEVFEIGKGKVVRHSPQDKVTLVGSGITLHESVKAAEILATEGLFFYLIFIQWAPHSNNALEQEYSLSQIHIVMRLRYQQIKHRC